MAELYATKTRLQLLAEIANGQVLTDITRDDDQAGPDLEPHRRWPRSPGGEPWLS